MDAHRSEIFAKLVTIMGDVTQNTCRILLRQYSRKGSQATSPTARDVSVSDEPDSCVAELMKQVGCVHRTVASV